mmetsp:Transcript_10206/g.13358  ORF Transcript_10206/g.13358 Transcript_10206/m.13358 type:complete len:275 (-) Transcript_10206:105-929(-)
MTTSAPRPSNDFSPARSMPAWEALFSEGMWVAPTYPTMKPILAFAAEPTPDPLSSTATQRCGGNPTLSAALRYTSGAGLNAGGVKSDSPEWMEWGGKKARRPQASTQTGTRGFPEVVAIQKDTPAERKPLRVSRTVGFASAQTASASTVSSFCCSSRDFSALVSLSGFRPKAFLCSSTTAIRAGATVSLDSLTGANPAALLSLSNASSMNSKAFPALSCTYGAHIALTVSAFAPTMYGANSQNATCMAGVSVSPSVPSKSNKTPTLFPLIPIAS